MEKTGVYGVPLCESICYARSTVGYVDEDSIKHRRAGIIPLVIAKCGSFLKAHGMLGCRSTVELCCNLLSMKACKRKEYSVFLETISASVHFRPCLTTRENRTVSTWTGSGIPCTMLLRLSDGTSTSYPSLWFRTTFTRISAMSWVSFFLNIRSKSQKKKLTDFVGDKHYHSIEERIQAFQHLIQHLPIPHQHLLLYLLDLLSLFASNAVETKMDAASLAIVFAPGILSHPQHHSPVQYRISQRVLEFLIEFQALFTMELLTQKMGSSNKLKGAPPVPPIPNELAAPRATKSDPLLPLSPQPIRIIPPQLLSQADRPLDEKRQATPPPSQTPEEDGPTPRATTPVAQSFTDTPPQSPPLSLRKTPRLQEDPKVDLVHAVQDIYDHIRRMLPWQGKSVTISGLINLILIVKM